MGDEQSDSSKQNPNNRVWTSLCAGALAGALAKTVIAPLDRTKIHFQTSSLPYSWRGACNWLMTSYSTEGVLSLWRGNSATIARIAPYAAVQFAAHEQWKSVLGVDTSTLARTRRVRQFVAGSLAGVTSQSATYPLDLARARMAVARANTYRSLAHVFVSILRKEGFTALYRGYPATVLGVIPYAGVSFFTYDSLKYMYQETAPLGPLQRLMCGACAGVLGQTASYPLDVVRRRMQTSKLNSDGHYVYRSIASTLRDIYKAEGWRGYFKGLSMNWVKGPLAVGISFSTYDSIKTSLNNLAVSIECS